MDFNELNELIPFARYGKEKILTMQPYNAITLGLPGRHAEDTTPKGGDFVVMVDSSTLDWTRHQFTHTDLFKDIEAKSEQSRTMTRRFMESYFDVVLGSEPEIWDRNGLPGLHPMTLLYALQCLAVAEHRRYAIHEKKYGGRYLPFRFAAGIAQGLWTAADAANLQKRGRPGVEMLEKQHGRPDLTGDLIIHLGGKS